MQHPQINGDLLPMNLILDHYKFKLENLDGIKTFLKNCINHRPTFIDTSNSNAFAKKIQTNQQS